MAVSKWVPFKVKVKRRDPRPLTWPAATLAPNSLEQSLMTGEIAALILYLAVKLTVYSAWCWYGIRLLSKRRGNLARSAIGFGLLRLVIGFLLGLGLITLLSTMAPEKNRLGFGLINYLAALVALRWVEWSGISALIQWPAVAAFFLGTSNRDRLWRVGGIAVSFVSDVLVIGGGVGLYGVPC